VEKGTFKSAVLEELHRQQGGKVLKWEKTVWWARGKFKRHPAKRTYSQSVETQPATQNEPTEGRTVMELVLQEHSISSGGGE